MVLGLGFIYFIKTINDETKSARKNKILHFFVITEMLSVGNYILKLYNCYKKFERRSTMTTSRLLHERMKEKGYSKIRLQNELGCCEKTLRNYLNGTTISGPYLMKLLAILNISVSEWNSCINIKQEEVLL